MPGFRICLDVVHFSGKVTWEKKIYSSPGRLKGCSTYASYHFIIASLPSSSSGLLEILITVPDKSSRASFGTPGLDRDQRWTVSRDRGWNPISHSDNFPSRRISPGTKTLHRVNPLSRAQARQGGKRPQRRHSMGFPWDKTCKQGETLRNNEPNRGKQLEEGFPQYEDCKEIGILHSLYFDHTFLKVESSYPRSSPPFWPHSNPVK